MFVRRHKNRSFFFGLQKQMTSDDLCPPANTVCITFNDLFRKLKIGFYCANECVFAIISYSGLSSATLLHVYLGNLPKETPVRGQFCKFFYLDADEQGKTR